MLKEKEKTKKIARAGRIVWDTTVPYFSPLNSRIDGYSQKTRASVRLWRARAGHVGHLASIIWAQGTTHVNLPNIKFGDVATPEIAISHVILMAGTITALLGTLYIDLIKKDSWSMTNLAKPRRRIRERIHKFYPFIPQ